MKLNLDRSKLILIVMLIFFWFGTAKGQEQQPMIGQPAPAFNLSDLNGKQVSLLGLRGNLVVIHFAASW